MKIITNECESNFCQNDDTGLDECGAFPLRLHTRYITNDVFSLLESESCELGVRNHLAVFFFFFHVLVSVSWPLLIGRCNLTSHQ